MPYLSGGKHRVENHRSKNLRVKLNREHVKLKGVFVGFHPLLFTAKLTFGPPDPCLLEFYGRLTPYGMM